MSPGGVALAVGGSDWTSSGVARLRRPAVTVAEEARGPHAARPEPRTRPVDGSVGLTPPVVRLVQQPLDGRALRLDQPLHAHPDKPDPRPLEPECVEQRLGRVEDLT